MFTDSLKTTTIVAAAVLTLLTLIVVGLIQSAQAEGEGGPATASRGAVHTFVDFLEIP